MFTRRNFIASTMTAGVALAAGCATQPARKRTIVDAQIHLWKANTPDVPWAPGGKPQLPEPFTVERALPLMDEVGVDRVVIVTPALYDRNDYPLEVARRYPNRFGVMGRILLQDPKSAALLPRWREQKGMLGCRVTFNNPTTSKWLSDGTADRFWAAAEKAGVPVMFYTLDQLPRFAPIAERYPGLQLIIDHMGVDTTIAKEGKMTEHIGQAVALAKYSNVSIKLSNLVNASLEPYPFRDLTPHLKRLFDAYGPQRCHWGTDLTNTQFTRVSYRQRVTHFTEELPFLSESDKDWVMGRAILQRLRWA